VDATGVARIYRGLIDTLIFDEADAEVSTVIESMGIAAVARPTLMDSDATRRSLGLAALNATGLQAK
jgi:hypothetical protein